MADKQNPHTKHEYELLREFAHEIRTPLTAMLGYTAYLKDGKKADMTPAKCEDYAKRLYSSTTRLLEITERVLDEAVRGSPRIKIEELDFNTMAQELVDTFEALASERGVGLEMDISDEFPILHTDSVLLYEMMTNLISNALKFTPKGGKVCIKGEVDVNQGGIILVIQDTGKGIPAPILMRMMQGNGRRHSTSNMEIRGWGQGVELVRQKARLLGGRLEIENAPVGGTVACIRLPAD